MASNNVRPGKLSIQELFLQKLDNSIKQYSALLKHTRDPDEASSIQELLSIFKNRKRSVLGSYKQEKPHFSFRSDATQQQQKGIKDIFNFYSKQHLMAGKAPTFDRIGEVVDFIDVGSFVFFCKSFGLVSDRKTQGTRYLHKTEVVAIFKKCAVLQKQMECPGFVRSLNQLADLYFNTEYDSINSTAIQNLTIEQKRGMLYEFIKCGDHKFLQHALKPIGGAFYSSVEQATRISALDPGNTFKNRVSEEVREQIKQHKREKEVKVKMDREAKIKESNEKAKFAQKQIRERMEQDEIRRRRDVIRIQDLAVLSYRDLGDNGDLEELIK